MKKVITTIALVLSIVALTNAQIKKPKVKVNTTPIETNTKLQGVKVNNLSRLKTIADFEKLNIPVQQMTKEKLHAKPTQTWKINPRIINDGVLKFERLDGWMTTNSWNFGRGPERTIREDVERLNSGRSAGGVFDLKIEFKVIGGIEYRLKLKEIDPWGIYQDKYLFVSRSSSNGLYISRINMNELNEFNYIFSEPKSCDIKLGFTGTAHVDPSVEDYKWFPVTIAEVRIDRLN
tara:strand:- start:188107 stop:188808 length:702 start_codon:yes stop_codon:yes gene_type:complete